MGRVLIGGGTTYQATRKPRDRAPGGEADGGGGEGRPGAGVGSRLQRGRRCRHVGRAPLVGREQRLTLLQRPCRAARERRPQLLTLVGVPGSGESRLVFEDSSRRSRAATSASSSGAAAAAAYARRDLVGALGDRQGAAASLESDTSEAPTRAPTAVARFRPGPCPRPAGRAPPAAARGCSSSTGVLNRRPRERGVAAWRRFFGALGGDAPAACSCSGTCIDEARALLDFVDHLVDSASGVPVLAVYHFAHSSRAGQGRAAARSNWSASCCRPVHGQTAALVHALLGRPAVCWSTCRRDSSNTPAPIGSMRRSTTRMLTERPPNVDPPGPFGIIAAPPRHPLARGEGPAPDAAVIGTCSGSEPWAGPRRAARSVCMHSSERSS